MESQLTFAIVFVVSFAVGVWLYRYLVSGRTRFEFQKQNTTGERFASQSKPVLGGVGFYALFLIGSIATVCVHPSYLTSIDFLGFVLSASLAFFVGLFDDMKNMSPRTKFAGQLLCGLVLIASGLSIKLFPIPILNYALTLFWVVLLMNSLNMLDNMDAITGSTSAAILGSLLVVALVGNAGGSDFTFIMVSVLAALFCYLIYNWHPSRIYMGDNGSLFIGLFLAVLSIKYIWNGDLGAVEAAQSSQNYFKPVLCVSLMFIVPFTDTITVTINRLLRGQSPFVGGRDHTTHNLYFMGLSVRQVGITLLLVSIASNAVVFIIHNSYQRLSPLQFVAFSMVGVLILASLYTVTRIPKSANVAVGKQKS